MTELCLLKNGSTVFLTVAKVVLSIMKNLHKTDTNTSLRALQELVYISYDSRHRLWGNTGFILLELGLLYKDGEQFLHVHDSVRDIVRSSIRYNDAELVISDPVEGL